MSEERVEEHPFRQWEGTEQWAVVDRALAELIESHDLYEGTRHEYVVGYLCKALASVIPLPPSDEPPTEQRKRESLYAMRRAQELMRPYRQPGRSLVDELIAERRAEAACE